MSVREYRGNLKLRRPSERIPYALFLVHLFAFAGSGFFMAYGLEAPLRDLYAAGGLAIVSYLGMYYSKFGGESLKWIATNAVLGLYGIAVEIDFLLSFFGRSIRDYPISVHVIPFSYYVLYTFLVRQAILDTFGGRDDEEKRQRLDRNFVVGSTALYSLLAVVNFFK